MSSPPKKMRKSGIGIAAATLQSESVPNLNDDIPMDEDIDPASLYEDQEGNSYAAHYDLISKI